MDSWGELLEALLNSISPSEILDDAYLSLVEALTRVDRDIEFISDYHFIDEVVHKRYPHGLPCDGHVSKILRDRIGMVGEEGTDEQKETYRHYSAIIKNTIWDLDQSIATLQGNFFAQCQAQYEKYDEEARKKVQQYYEEIKQLSDDRFPLTMTIHDTRREDLDKLIRKVELKQLNARVKGL